MVGPALQGNAFTGAVRVVLRTEYLQMTVVSGDLPFTSRECCSEKKNIPIAFNLNDDERRLCKREFTRCTPLVFQMHGIFMSEEKNACNYEYSCSHISSLEILNTAA